MRKPGFFEGVGVALVAAFVGAAGFFTLNTYFYHPLLLQFFITTGSFSYILYLLWRSQETTGRISVVTAWLALSGLCWILSPSLSVYLLFQLALIWLLRSLYFHSSVLVALTDMGLIVLGLLAAVWTWFNTQSPFLSIWCFFLIQSLFVLLPKHIGLGKQEPRKVFTNNRFEQAHRSAEIAIRQLAKQ